MTRALHRYAGAMLLYGPQAEPPDLSLAMQFLIDDLRFEGRAVSWIALKGLSLRLRLEGYELVLAHNGQKLPAGAFQGLQRPAAARTAVEGGDLPGDTDLARGRVLHAIRNHRYAVSLLLRARGAQPGEAGEAASQLAHECRALIEPILEAAPPALVIWQPGGLTLTAEEFRAVRADRLLAPGATNPLMVDDRPVAPHRRRRPTETAESLPALLPLGELVGPIARTLDPGQPAEVAAHRTDRARRRSAGRLFAPRPPQGRATALPRLHRQDARLVAAFRTGETPPLPDQQRRAKRVVVARAANAAALVLWYVQLLPELPALF